MIGLREQIACVAGEIARRERLVPRLDSTSKVLATLKEITRLRAVLATLQGLDRFYAAGREH